MIDPKDIHKRCLAYVLKRGVTDPVMTDAMSGDMVVEYCKRRRRGQTFRLDTAFVGACRRRLGRSGHKAEVASGMVHLADGMLRVMVAPPDTGIERVETEDELDLFVRTLTKNLRGAVMLRYGQVTMEHIGRLIDLSESRVSQLLSLVGLRFKEWQKNRRSLSA